jgi:hypothetical protein
MAQYSFISVWRVGAPREHVWSALTATDYTLWWPNVVANRILTPDLQGVGVRLERVVRGRLPYNLRYVTTTTYIDPPSELAYTSESDLHGNGRMALEDENSGTRITFHWNVETTGFWMNLLTPFLRPLFAWNHHRVMAAGERGLQTWLLRDTKTP